MSGIGKDIVKQIEAVENDHDASTAAAFEAVERRGEMVVRVIEPRQLGRQAVEAIKKFVTTQVYPTALPLTRLTTHGPYHLHDCSSISYSSIMISLFIE